MDQELFELCKDVYKRTGWWKPSLGFIYNKSDCKCGYKANAPLYTSDYLLEKLLVGRSNVEFDRDNGWVSVGYSGKVKNSHFQVTKWATARTHLKALLKLVIALDDAGELK